MADLDGTISISRTTADAVREWRVENQRNVDRPDAWFHLGADFNPVIDGEEESDQVAEVLTALGNSTAFLMVGTVEPRKGHAQVLEAFSELWRAGVDEKLVIVGGRGWGVDGLVTELAAHPELGRRLFWLDAADDHALDLLYRRADCLLSASRGEGFGLPIVEAARHGVPLLLRDISVFREIAGDHASWFPDSMDPQVVLRAIKAWCTAKSAGQLPQSAAIPVLTWQQCAERLRELVTSADWYLGAVN